MRFFAGLFLIGALASANASAQVSLNTDPYLIAVQGTLNFDADDVRIASEVRRGESIISIGVAHTRTGILQNNLRRNFGLVSVVPAGVPGYYAGQFAPDGGPSGDMWCFARNAQNLGAGVSCVIDRGVRYDGVRIWREAAEPTNPYFPVSAAINPRAPPLPAPEIAEQAVEIHPDLRIEYIFVSWGDSYVELRTELGGRPTLATGVRKRIRLEADGSALLRTPFGTLRIERDGRNARVSVLTL